MTHVTAKCKKRHSWDAIERIAERDGMNGLMLFQRIVSPERCPVCKDRWHEIHVRSE